MKLFLRVFLIGVLLLCICNGCTTTTPKTVVEKGQPYTLSKGNCMTIRDAIAEENRVVVELSVDFSTEPLSALKEAAIRNTDGEHREIYCDRVLEQEVDGETRIVLLFTDNSVQKGMDLSRYVLTVPVGRDADGSVARKDAMVLG